MSERKSAFLEKLKALPLDELVKYETAAVQAGRITDVVGIGCFLLMFFFPMELVFLLCVPIVCVAASMGAGIGNSLVEISRILANPKRADK